MRRGIVAKLPDIEVAYLGDVLADVAPSPGIYPQSDVCDMTEQAHKEAMQ